MNDELNVIIFSKDRACQLEACVRSFFANFEGKKLPHVNVIWKASNDRYLQGYTYLQSKLSNINSIRFRSEANFKSQIEDILNTEPCSISKFTMFLVDDIVFVRKFTMNDKQLKLLEKNSSLLSVSLRLHKDVTHCYAANCTQKVPNFVKEFVWNWKDESYDWNYPMSVDGNIYKTDLIRKLVSKCEFNNPNTFESILNETVKQQSFPQYIACYPEAPRLINIPANRVQHVFNNRFDKKNMSAYDLNEAFLNGYKIDYDAYKGVKQNAVHCPIDIEMNKRENRDSM